MAQNDFENKRDTADQKIDLRLWKRLTPMPCATGARWSP